jgi:hypothetical protein
MEIPLFILINRGYPMQELTFKQIFSVILGTLTVIFICNFIGISSEVAMFLFAPVNLFIMLMAHVYILATKGYAKKNINKNNSAFLNNALGVGVSQSIANATLSAKDTLIAIFFFACPILSLWRFAITIMAIFYDIMVFIEKNTIQKFNYGK